MKNILLTLLFLSSVFSATNVFAEPSKVIKFLMTEEVTLFDRGMDKLSSQFDGMEIESIGYFLTKVSYDWSANKIFITSSMSPNSRDAKNKTEADEWCKKTIKHMKFILGIFDSPKRSLHEYSYMNQYFSHYGFKNNQESTNRGRGLDRITFLRATIQYEDKTKIDASSSCEGALMNKDIRFIQ